MVIDDETTAAFIVSYRYGQLSVHPATYLKSSCVDPREAIGKVRSGEKVIIAGSDMAQFNELWKALI